MSSIRNILFNTSLDGSVFQGDLPTEEFKPDMDLGTPQLIPILLVNGTWRGKPQTLVSTKG
jgi:hypothetical protein